MAATDAGCEAVVVPKTMKSTRRIALLFLLIASNNSLDVLVNASSSQSKIVTSLFVPSQSLRHIASTPKNHPPKLWNKAPFLPNTFRHLPNKLSLSNSSNYAAGGTLVLSSLLGLFFDAISKQSGGHVITLLSAAVVSNLSQKYNRIPNIPTEHYLYDLCWSFVLPASLVFALLSSSTTPINTEEKPINTKDVIHTNHSSNRNSTTKECIQSMSLPFLMASLGSIVGCLLSFLCIPLSTASSCLEAKTTSAILAGCLCASYIGGTVNFFAAGKLLMPLSNSNDMGNVFGSMAAVDLVVMAVYFAVLGGASRLGWLRQLFPGRTNTNTDSINTSSAVDGNNTIPMVVNSRDASILNNIGAAFIAISLALSSVFFASRLEISMNNLFRIPGTMCAFLAMFGLLYNKLIQVAVHCTFNKRIHCKRRLVKAVCSHLFRTLYQIQFIGPTLCNLSFFLLFGAIGTTADISSAILGGPMILLYALFALLVHATILLFGTYVTSRLTKCSPSWHEVLTASNAAIGGPSTAAAFASGLVTSSEADGSHGYQRALVLSATVYGVLGYAVGTSVGVALSRLLLLLTIQK